ncbi:TPA: hypothetical protein ACGJRA_002421 [Pseudomonas aeruginosa]|uniref:hypothetical protein n=1 Tax=Pseudomonas aeruginosa TaxID=287 RepID=UPI0006917511|nr:hypothetical protein [Pseudomonas aeruginosa]UXH58365.1 hypothetical protein N5877_28080 [Pseudomonas aeruginosa]HCF1755690.1 hypothetical protein [Pseudomonas aeruginosa]
MTTPIVQSISDEQLAELDELTAKLAGEDWWVDWDGSYAVTASPSNIQSLIARLRAAEADAQRYRWLRGFERGGITVRDLKSHLHVEGLDAAIDEAMEHTP